LGRDYGIFAYTQQRVTTQLKVNIGKGFELILRVQYQCPNHSGVGVLAKLPQNELVQRVYDLKKKQNTKG
jgi:hypothetical protein